MNLQLRAPSNILLVGATQCGKTSLVANLLKDREELFDVCPRKVIYICRHKTNLIDYLETNHIIDKCIQLKPESFSWEDLLENELAPLQDYDELGRRGVFLVLDDILSEINGKPFESLYGIYGSKFSITFLIMSLRLYYNNDGYRTLSSQAHYLFLFRDIKNSKQNIENLSRQSLLFPKEFLIQSYARATKLNYSYLLLDYTNQCPDIARIRTNILRKEWPIRIFVKN